MQQDIHITEYNSSAFLFHRMSYVVNKTDCAQVSLGHLLQTTIHENCKWQWRW